MKTIPKSTFTKAFIRLNRLEPLGFGRWIFLPGMEFEAQDKWWQTKDRRPTPHEGLDLCCFEDRTDRLVYLPEKSRVPVLYDGRVVRVFTDFLGKSIIVEHDFHEKERSLYSIYAHTVPDNDLHAGNRVLSGEAIASTCSSKNKHLHTHLHLTILWAPETVIGNLDWQSINQTDQVTLCDPQFFL